MKINTIFSVLIAFIFSLPLIGQERNVGKILTYDPPVFSRSSPEAAVDTLYPPVSSTCDLSQLFLYGVTGGGYITGTNTYGDLEKAQLFPNPTPAEAGITGVLVFFGEKEIVGSADGIVAKVYSEGSNNEPDMLMGTSDTLSTAAIDTNGALSHFNFQPVTYSSPFFVSIVVDALDDTVGIVHTNDGCGLSNAFELWSNNTWHRIDTAWGESDISLEVFVIVDDAFVGIDENIISGKGLDIYPNPVIDDELRLNFEEALKEDAILRIKSVNGGGVVERKLDFERAKTGYSININNLSSGAHILEIETGSGLMRKVFVKQ